MDIINIELMYDTKRDEIIKQKNEVLDITIKCGVFKHDVNIYVDYEKICIGKKEYKISELKQIFIWGVTSRYGGYASSLEFKFKGTFNGVSLTVTDLAEEDVLKVKELFEHFIFSNECNLEKLESDLYIPLLNENNVDTSVEIEKYKVTDEVKNKDVYNNLLNDKYYLYKILPREKVNKFKNKKNYLVYESKFTNENYIDIWMTEEEYIRKGNELKFRIHMTMALLSIMCICIVCSLFVTSCSLFYEFEILKGDNSFINLFIPNLFSLIIIGGILLLVREKYSILISVILSILISTIGVTAYDTFKVPKKYDYTLINGKEISMIKYKYFVVKDKLDNKLSIAFIEKTDRYNEYVTYISEENNKKYRVAEDLDLIKLIDKLAKVEDKVKVEYYTNSGIIKTIDGIDKKDLNKLEERVNELSQNIYDETVKKMNELAVSVSDKREKAKIKNNILENAVSKKFDDVKSELDKYEISDYSVEYLSSKLYSVGSITFVTKMSPYILYVVKDNAKEDMVKMPKLEFGMTKDEIIQILKIHGLDYECDTVNWGDHEKGTLHTSGYAPGTLLPKGIKVWFSIDI